MARPSKAHRFAIHEDTGIPTPDSACQDYSFDDAINKLQTRSTTIIHSPAGITDTTSPRINRAARADSNYVEPDTDHERRISALARTSISSLPESAEETENEHTPYKPSYTVPIIRPSFRRPESVRRMQMSSPGPFDRSPRRSFLHRTGSRMGSPQSVRSSGRGGPRPKRADSQMEFMDQEGKDFPLVLLHITLLPVEFAWSMGTIQDLMPADTLESLRLLQSKVTKTICHRGILIPHPHEEYELLEERLMEALELRNERVTRCGHFRSRDSTSSTESSVPDSDSGLGSSLDEAEIEICRTCQHRIKTHWSGVEDGNRRWSIKVFAANGLMRASAWSAAWSEMERVDVEILPWISEDLRMKLDEREVDTEAERRATKLEEEARALELINQGIASNDNRAACSLDDLTQGFQESKGPATHSQKEPTGQKIPTSSLPRDSDLLLIYHTKDIPLTVLLKNYLYLLAQDSRNMAILLLVVVALWLGFRGLLAAKTGAELDAMDGILNTVQSLRPIPNAEVQQTVEMAELDQALTPMETSASVLAAETTDAPATGEDSDETDETDTSDRSEELAALDDLAEVLEDVEDAVEMMNLSD